MRVWQEAMNETFLLSNIAPQVGEGFNRHCMSPPSMSHLIHAKYCIRLGVLGRLVSASYGDFPRRVCLHDTLVSTSVGVRWQMACG